MQEHPNSSPKDIQDLLWKQWSGCRVAPLSLGGVGGVDNVQGEGLDQNEGGPAKKKAKKEKRVKDPLAPKRPACAYLLFFHSMKAEVTKIFINFVLHANPGDGQQTRDDLQGGDDRDGEGVEQ